MSLRRMFPTRRYGSPGCGTHYRWMPSLRSSTIAALPWNPVYAIPEALFRDVTLRYVFRLTSVVFADNRVRFLPHE
jgi:hypothetical protein